MGDLVIAEAFPGMFTFEELEAMEFDEWFLLYTKAEFTLQVIRREVVKDEYGYPIVDEDTGNYVTISQYPHLESIKLFGVEKEKVESKTAPPPVLEPTPQTYKIDPKTGQQVFVNKELSDQDPQVDTLSGGDGFSFKVP